MTDALQPAADVMSPAETQSWQEWADKSPALLRETESTVLPQVKNIRNPLKIFGIVLGAVLGAATLTPWVKGNWKWATGLGAAGAGAGAYYVHRRMQQMVAAANATLPPFKQAMLVYADALERDAGLRRQLAGYLSTHVTGKEIEALGFEAAVAGSAIEFGTRTPYLNQSAISRQAVAGLSKITGLAVTEAGR